MSRAPGAEGAIRAPQLRIEHVTPFRQAGVYAPFPVVEALADGRLPLVWDGKTSAVYAAHSYT